MNAHSNIPPGGERPEKKARRFELFGNPPQLDEAGLEQTCLMLERGGVFLYPTDTIYGLGCSALEESAIQRLFRLKERPLGKGLLVLVEDIVWVEDLASGIPRVFWKLQKELWPGPFTFILKASASLPADLTGDSGTIGVRHPALFFLRHLLREFGKPIVSTSANLSGQVQMETLSELIRTFESRIDLIVESTLEAGPPSTVIDLTGKEPRIVRAGAQMELARRALLSS